MSYGLLSVENPGRPTATYVTHDAVLAGLQRDGYDVEEVVGVWDGAEERSLFVSEVPFHVVYQLAKDTGQEAFIFDDCLIYLEGGVDHANSVRWYQGRLQDTFAFTYFPDRDMSLVFEF